MVDAVGNENGMIIAIGLLFLAIIALVSSTAMLVTTSDMKYGGNFKARVQASYFSEAGVNEALFRMNLLYTDKRSVGEKPGDPPTPSWHCQIVTSTSPQADQIASLQAIDGDERKYTVDIRYKKEDAHFNNGSDDDEIVYWGRDFGYGKLAPPHGQNPVVVITSEGDAHGRKHTLVAEATRLPVDIHVLAALTADNGVQLKETTFISGLNHHSDTMPSDDNASQTGSQGDELPLRGNYIDNHGGGEEHEGIYVTDYDTNLKPDANEDILDSEDWPDEVDILYGAQVDAADETHLPGVISSQAIDILDAGVSIYGHNFSWMKADHQKSWKDLSDLIGVTEDQLQKMLDKADVTNQDAELSGQSLYIRKAPEGITYITSETPDVQVRFPNNTEGWGLLYIKGDLDLDRLTCFKGLIFVEGSVELGDFWLLGAMAAQQGAVDAPGGGEILFSQAALDENVGAAMKYIVLGWNDGRNL